ncbi:LOW QUALITY PROTEIN: hypothetical protein V1477_015537 [Vespula maculifrons]|uniref:Uncharacterized protein n=1 Tax=Vespula maculifrons TaxID=7453 RepID=A0ABD2BEP8_VESMC
MQSRESRLRETTKNSGLGLTFPVTTSVVLWTSTRELRNFRGCHPCKWSLSRDDDIVGSWTELSSYYFSCALDFDERTYKFSWMPTMQTQMQIWDTRFGETTTNYGVGPNFTVTSSVVLLTWTGELRNLRGCHPLKCYIWIVGFERRQQCRVLDRPLQLLVQLSFGRRRENLEIFVDAIHASINERESRLRETTTNSGLGLTFPVTTSIVLWTSTRELRNFRGCHPCKLKCYIGIVGFDRRQQGRLIFGLLKENLEIFADAIHASINEQLIQIHDGIFGFSLKCRVGILGFEKRRQSQVLDRPLQILVQLCCGLRRENLEIFADAIHASINEQLIQIYDGIFGFRLKCRSRLRETTKNSGLGLTFPVTTSVVLWTSTRELRNFRGCHPCKWSPSRDDDIVGSWTELSSYYFSCALDFDERTYKFSWMPTMQTQMQIWDTRFGETTTNYGVGPNFTVTSSVVLLTWTGELRNLRGCHP